MAIFQGVQEEIPSGHKVQDLGGIYALMPPFAVVEPRSTLAILDIGSYVVCSDSRDIIGIVTRYMTVC